jgi:uncharacterized membrane protein HdeD (DUF308 family)
MFTTSDSATSWQDKAMALERGWLLSAAIVSILIGVFILFRPQAGVLTIAITFGLYLIFAGVSRFSFAITGKDRSTGLRWFGGILGVLIVAAGFYCLINLESSMIILGITLGIGLIGLGITDLVNSNGDGVGRPSWLRITGGILSIVAGIIMLFVPFVSITIVVWTGAFILIVLGVVGIAALPPATRADDPYADL